ncbi:glycosyltransferase family 4 protein [Spiribacter vilamensis]|uniref:Glycosyltransferase involved in cell wall biosynthesis n=1 Tax=Spiribacter vilamensis TaxID=531306 RepID=A0A4Q8D1B6_9GAMM|nr:glycosyltransferase family 4 protein [Spiribacter vilamensis]RZU99094.1 glycosyltransferase involved in cell wall biosynthesis [Spiribacter vilamensis]TVO61909.1 glycosyltransferase family 4 protein [Spiribacter vilamensis]
MKILLFANTDWYLYNFRRSLALALKAAGHQVLLVSPPGLYGARLQALGLEWRPAPMERLSLNPWREFRLLVWLIRLVRREDVALVHGFTIKCAVYGSLAARLAGGRNRVSAVAGLGYVFTSRSLKARLLRPVVRRVLRIALGGRRSRLILQNPDDAAMFREAQLIDSRQVRLIPGSGVDTERFLPAEKPPAGDTFRVVLPARLLWDKGVGELVEAARLLKDRNVPVSLLLAGEPDAGNPAAVPVEQLQAWQQAGLIEWLGNVDDMPALFRSVNAIALPTYYGEGLPKSLIEAAACSLPLVTTDQPGCREVVTHEIDGLLVPPRDANALADAIERLASDPALCVRLGHAARRKALAEFDERIVIERTMAVYDELIEDS